MAAGYSVNLTVAFQSNYELYNDLGFRLIVVCTIDTNNPSIYTATPSNLYSTCTALTGTDPRISTISYTTPTVYTSPMTSAACVFRYHQNPTNPDGTTESVFSGVCSWPDYTELPVAIPGADTLPASFRLNYIDLVVESETVANEVWQLLITEVTQLMQTISDGQTMATGDTVPCPSQ